MSLEMIRPRGVVSKLYPIFVGYIACEHSFTGTLLGLYWDAPVLLLSVASNVSVTGRRLRGDLAMLLEARHFSSCFS